MQSKRFYNFYLKTYLIVVTLILMKYYVINLDSRPDRYFKVEDQFLMRGISLERISAVSGKELVALGEETIAPPNNQAVWMSHRKVYEELIRSGDEYCFVFEDDVVMTEEAFRLLKEFEYQAENLPRIDYLQFGYLTYRGKLDSGEFDFRVRCNQRVRIWFYFILSKILSILQRFSISLFFLDYHSEFIDKVRRRIRKYSQIRLLTKNLRLSSPLIYSNESGGHAYIINRNFAKALLRFNLPLFLVTDLGLISLAKAANFLIYRTGKSLAFQDTSLVSTGIHSSKTFDISSSL